MFQLFYGYIVFTLLFIFWVVNYTNDRCFGAFFFFVGINGINVGVQNLATDEYITISAFWAFEPLGPLKTPQPCGLATSVFAVDGVNFSERPIDSC